MNSDEMWDRIERWELVLCAVITALILAFFNEPIRSNTAVYPNGYKTITVIVEGNQ